MNYTTTNTTTRHPFWSDLEKGQNKEIEVANLFKSANWSVTTTSLDQGRFEDYDFIVNCKGRCENVKIEVKYDILSSTTGNIAVEISKTINNKIELSGINTTKADVIIYALPDKKDFYAYDTSYLKQLVDQNKYKRIVKGGQGGRSNMALFDKTFFIKNATRINYEFLK